MALYTVKKIYTYSEEVEIEAESSQEAKDKAIGSKLLEDLYRRRGMTE